MYFREHLLPIKNFLKNDNNSIKRIKILTYTFNPNNHDDINSFFPFMRTSYASEMIGLLNFELRNYKWKL